MIEATLCATSETPCTLHETRGLQRAMHSEVYRRKSNTYPPAAGYWTRGIQIMWRASTTRSLCPSRMWGCVCIARRAMGSFGDNVYKVPSGREGSPQGLQYRVHSAATWKGRYSSHRTARYHIQGRRDDLEAGFVTIIQTYPPTTSCVLRYTLCQCVPNHSRPSGRPPTPSYHHPPLSSRHIHT